MRFLVLCHWLCAATWLHVVAGLIAALAAAPAAACECCQAIGLPACGYSLAEGMPSDSAAADDNPGVARFVAQGSRLPGFTGAGNPITVTYSYGNFLNGDLKFPSGASYQPNYLRRVTEEAFALWAAVVPVHFIEVEDNGPEARTLSSAYASANPADFGQIRIGHGPIDGSDVLLSRATTKARAWFPNAGGNRALDIEFDTDDRWRINGTGPEPDVLGIMVHEIGHVLGLAHTNLSSAVMFFAPPRRNGPGTAFLAQDDINGVQSLYGAGIGSVTGLLSIPEPATLALVGGAALAASSRRWRRLG